ncbi:hypothetical protein DFO73_110222 [Cytobacillus oceanisediminis]|uniref:Uncharacterized protein n=1 Tax=Cytobacillus oceanisediminis TaxID=665099 RepID=A0A2V2ZQM3_9BACI|nr:hypothetical protein [Cytobacillus oceanisediminis]PWW26648.1 hypothetical protein DFO73_110222 [Cytobacillus oceanisediminis]
MYKRSSLLLLMFIIIFCGINNVNVFAKSKGEGKPPKSVCVEEFEKEWKKFDNVVLKDIVKSYKLDLSGYQEFKHSDLNLKVGDNLNDHSDKISLQHLFVGYSIGSMRLFLENGLEGTKGYFLYKRNDGNNILKELHKKGEVWVVMSVYEKKAVRFYLKPFNWNKCTEN